MIPSLDQLARAQNAINSQHPYLARIPEGEVVARRALDAFDAGPHPAATFSPDVEAPR